MDTVSRNDISWRHFQLFPSSVIPVLDQIHLESVIIEHQPLEKEIELHRCRNRINQYEKTLAPGRNWEYYKKIVNPFEIVYTQKKYPTFPESICFLKPLSRSYFKMIEMLDLADLFGLWGNEPIRSAHVCEGPGGFIEALFDEAAKQKRRIQMSMAMTLKSKRTNIPGWKRAAYFLQKNKNISILFGSDDTGNIMKPENQQYFIDHATYAEQGGKVHLFTADGGFDFSGDYSKQEEMVFPLLMASTKIGLEALKPGGVFVLKLFDFYRKATTDLIYFLSCHFQEWTLYKPCMSRPCNPEHYFIGKGFTGYSDTIQDVMRIWCSLAEQGRPMDSLFSADPSPDFCERIQILRDTSFRMQTEYLERVFHIIEQNNEEVIQQYLRQNERSSYEWCVRFKVPIYAHRLHSAEE
jgi:23S rRNA U2552 (ribose-2'-O)-methylase RlmE/FtsJ